MHRYCENSLALYLGFDPLCFLQLWTLRAHIQIYRRPVVLNVGNRITSVYKYTNMVANPLLAEKELALASRCSSLSSSMQKPPTSSCPTITYEEALRRELEYRKRLESTHPHLLIGLNGAPALSKVSFLSDNFSVSYFNSEHV
jgi:hypothetical protein